MLTLKSLSTKITIAILVLAFAVPLVCLAQASLASLTGIVADPGGALIPNASVKLINVATREERQSSTSGEGRFTFSQLLPGNYELTATASGFRTFDAKDIRLVASQAGTLDVALQLGEINQRVEVEASAVQIDTQTANQNVTLEQKMVMSLPTNTRNPMILVQATAGVTAPRIGVTTGTADQNYSRFGMNGGRSTSTAILLDGVPLNAGTGWNGLIYSPTMDSVQELQVMRNAYDAQFGRSGGGVVSMVSKGGGPDFHGSAFDFIRNSEFDSNSWENNANKRLLPQFQRNQFGGAVAGPVWKSKRIFFLGSYEGLRQGSPSTSITTLPTALERQGDFSQTYNSNGTLSVIYSPFTNHPNPNGAGVVRDPFANNTIPRSLLDPVGVKAAALYPDPTGPGDAFTHANNYVGAGKGVSRVDRSDIRFDWARSEKHSVYFRLSKAWRVNDDPPAGVWQSIGPTGPYSQNPRYQVTLGNTIIPNPTLVINVLAGIGAWTERQRSQTYGQDGTAIGLPASFVGLLDAKTIPQIYPSGYSNISYSRDLNNISRTENLQVNATKERGAHTIKFGFNWGLDRLNGGAIYSADFYFSRGMTSGPTAAVDSSSSGNAIASMLLGTGSNSGSNQVQKPAILAVDRQYYALYVQDTWRVGQKLTLNPGIRYELQRPATERYNRFSNFDYSVANPLSSQVGMPLRGGLVFLNGDNRGSWNTDWANIAPRLGFAYKLTNRWVVRGGYGIFFPAVLGAGDSTGFSANTPQLTSVGGDGITPQDLFRNPYPNGLIQPMGSSKGLLTNVGLSAGSYQRDHPSGYIQNFSLDMQFELDKTTQFEIGYAGNLGRKLAWGNGLNDNQLPPQLLSLGADLDRQVANPFYGIITAGVLSSRTLPYNRLLRQFPEFDSVSRNSNTPGGSSSYNAMLVKLTKQFSRGLLLLTSYQWSKAIDDIKETEPSLGGADDAFRNSFNFSMERALSAHDIPHSFATSLVYDLPFGRNRRFGSHMNQAFDLVAGGWQISSIMRFASGFLFRITAPNLNSPYGFGGQYPNLVPGQSVALSDPTPYRWFNTAAFSAPAPYSIGSAPRRMNELRADGQHNADLAIMKDFAITERIKLQFRTEMFNFTNTPQFGFPDSGFGSATFGRVTATQNVGPRQVQFSLRVSY
jgi:hypothetical protein